MGNLDQRILRIAGGYFGAVLMLVTAARAGLFPGAFERFGGLALADHPYRLAMAIVTAVLAVSLGGICAWAGRVSGTWHVGLGALLAGGMTTGTLLALAPMVLYPNDQYPVTFMWLLLGAPVGFVSWLALTLVWRIDHATA